MIDIFTQDVKDYRGNIRSSKSLQDIETVYSYGSIRFKEFMLKTKVIGFKLAAQIASSLTHEEQDNLVVFILNKKPKVRDIKLELLKY